MSMESTRTSIPPSSPTPQNDEYRTLLVDLLKEASQLEHCLLDAYLYAACSIKSTPQEFAEVAGKPNRRRAIQYERARAWKQHILLVAREEMLHLHYVECLLRGLGERPNFALPNRDEKTGNWIIPNWRARIGQAPVNEGEGVLIPIEPLSPSLIRQFVLFEASDSLQDANPFGPPVLDLFARLHAFEVDLYFESILFDIDDATIRTTLKQKLSDLYTQLTPLSEEDSLNDQIAAFAREAGLASTEEFRFQSIADLYNKGILPLYNQAFAQGWVTQNNRDLNNELLHSNAGEGFLPIGPTYRDQNFNSAYNSNVANPLRNYKSVDAIISEIVEEGEGQSDFMQQAEQLLLDVQKVGGARKYLQTVQQDSSPTPQWLANDQALRFSHLYRFAIVMAEFEQERDLARQSGVEFSPTRTPLDIATNPELTALSHELPSQFNACYLVLLVWLARMYEIPDWQGDQPERQAIEMLASWPLMSMAIRPFLELASFLPIDRAAVFRLEANTLPGLPTHSQQLLQLFRSPERSEAINKMMDTLAGQTLADVAAWAAEYQQTLKNCAMPLHAQQCMLARLTELSQLNEFEKQFPFRVAGGYSNIEPSFNYQQDNPDGADFSEDPSLLDPNNGGQALFQDTLVLRLSFAGWGLVLLATDPDPPYDEAGCTGTLMLHAADGDRRFDRSLIWQDYDSKRSIRREPREALPTVGVNCTAASLLVAAGSETLTTQAYNGIITSTQTLTGLATAGYQILKQLNSAGAVQTSGVQEDLQVSGFQSLIKLSPEDILGQGGVLKVNLLEKNGIQPFLNGNNHLIWRDGEPIDPFVISVSADVPTTDPIQSTPIFQREIYNQGHSLMEMSPLQRLLSGRGPCGFDSSNNIPAWVLDTIKEQPLITDPSFPMSYLKQRVNLLTTQLAQAVNTATVDDQATVDKIVSFAERMRLVSQPRSTTVNWLPALLHYGHTLSGDMQPTASNNPIFATLLERMGMRISLPEAPADRSTSNSRWLINYTLGVMDTDALSHLIYGDLYIPVAVESTGQPIRLQYCWTLPMAIKQAVITYACQFNNPFWNNPGYNVHGEQRTVTFPDGTLVTETLLAQTETSYRYKLDGIEQVQNAIGTFILTELESSNTQAELVQLEWNMSFEAQTSQAILAMASNIALVAEQQIFPALTAYFAPKES